LARTRQCLGVVQYASVPALQLTIRRHPGVEQARRFECRLQAGAAHRVHMVAKLHQLPQWRPRAITADTRVARVRHLWHGVFASLQAPPFIVERLLFVPQGPQRSLQLDAVRSEPLAGFLLCRVQDERGGIVAGQSGDPFAQGRQHFVGGDPKLPQASEVRVPALDQSLAFAFDSGIGLAAAIRCRVGVFLSGVQRLPVIGKQTLGTGRPFDTLTKQQDLLAAPGDDGTQFGSTDFESA
jgi:hypothetical protein